MSTDPALDPFEQMRQAYDEAVGGWAKTMEGMVGTQDFAAASGEFLKRYAELQENIRATSKATAEALHLPTRDDFARVAQLVINVERKVDEVSEDVHEVAARAEPASPDAALAAIADRIGAMEGRLAELAARPEPASPDAALGAMADRLSAIEGRLAELAKAAPAKTADARATATKATPGKAATGKAATGRAPGGAATTRRRTTRAPKAD